MESSGVRSRDNPALPPLSLGLSSVRHIVTKLETEYARVKCNDLKSLELATSHTDDHLNYPFERKVQVLNRFVGNLSIAFHKCIPSVTCGNFGFIAITTGFFAPRMMSYLVIYPFCRLVFGTLYPAYASYKAVRTKNLKEYVKWMMYWIVFALFTCTETFTDVFLSWFPFYYEVKIVIVLWLLSPATKGSSILYRKFVHPALCRREQEIDEYIAKAKDQGYHTVLNLGTKGVNYATTVIMQTAIKGGGGLVQQLRKSYSLSDLSACEPREERAADEADDTLADTRLLRRPAKSGFATRRSASESSRSPMYFPEVDVDVRAARRVDEPDFSHIKSTEDISSGYSSAENSSSLSRAGPGAARPRRRAAAVTALRRPAAAEVCSHTDTPAARPHPPAATRGTVPPDDDFIEELQDDDSFDYSNMPPLVQFSSPLYLSHTVPQFIYQYVGDQVKILQVLGNYPLNSSFNIHTDNPDIRDQKEDVDKTSVDTECKTDITSEKSNLNDIDIPLNIEIKDNKDVIVSENNNFTNNANSKETDLGNSIDNNRENKSMEKAGTDDSNLNVIENINDNPDEGSSGTLASTSKSAQKVVKGKYGKDKAPMPPSDNDLTEKIEIKTENSKNVSSIIKKEDVIEDNVLELPKVEAKETECATNMNLKTDIVLESDKTLVTCEAEPDLELASKSKLNLDNNDRARHKSKSPVPKAVLTFGKILQIPNKLAFWNKTDKQISDNVSDASDSSRKSSLDSLKDEFQSCYDINNIATDNENKSNLNNTLNGEISNDVIEKNDELQKVIEAKLETNPEYKFIPLCGEIPTSKSTDV